MRCQLSSLSIGWRKVARCRLTAPAGTAMTAGAPAQPVPQSRQQIQLSFAPVVKQAAPAVVNVFTSRVVQQQSLSPLFADPFFRQFFGDRLGGVPQKRVQNSLGSGVLVS